MKYILSFFLTLSVLCTSLSAVEYGKLLKNHSASITIGDGDVFTALEWMDRHYFPTTSSGYPGIITILQLSNMGDGQTHNLIATRHYNTGAISAPLVVVGPATIELPSSIDWMMYKINRASEVEYKNINIIALPSSTVGQGTHEIVVEASDDLQTWTPVHSSSIGGSKAFFRTRVTEIGD